MAAPDVVRFAAVGDLHCTEATAGAVAGFLAEAAEAVDALLLCGDLTDYGTAREARALADAIAPLRRPVVAVLGNHDHEDGRPDEVRRILEGAGVRVLDGEATEVRGVGIAGTKGFAGGFGRASLGGWGEAAIKRFVDEAAQEATRLESALAKLRTPARIAMLHYAPVRSTVEGEPPEIVPFLGSSRLEDPLLRHPVDVVVHGHAHRGTPEGRTVNGIPVFNVARPLLLRSAPGAPGWRLIELPVGGATAPPPGRRDEP